MLIPLGLLNQSPALTLLITEIYYDPFGNEKQEEWIEIANVGPVPVELGTVKIGDAAQSGGREGMLRFPPNAEIPPSKAVIIAQTASGFFQLYGRLPDFEIQQTDERVPDMRPFRSWASGEVALANSGDELLLLGPGLRLLDAINYGDQETYFSPAVQTAAVGMSLERVPADCDTDSAVDWQTQAIPAPGGLDFNGMCLPPLTISPADSLPPIGQIQGSAAVSPFVNGQVSLRGVVTGFYSEQNSRGVVYYTAFLQDLPGTEDRDPNTSDGIALFLGWERPSFALGDQLRVSGLVLEYYGLTELEVRPEDIDIEDTEVSLPPAVALPRPNADPNVPYPLEHLEGMRVQIAAPSQVVNPTYSSCGFTVWPYQDEPVRIIRRRLEDPAPQLVGVLHETDLQCGDFPDVKTGDQVAAISGPLTYHFEEYKIVQAAAQELLVTGAPIPPLPIPPAPTANQFSLSTLNMENHFDAVDDTGNLAEPKPTPAEIAVKQAKLAATIVDILGCPTLLALQEVEKASLLAELAVLTAVPCGFSYTVTHLESPDIRGIDVALLSNPLRVQIEAAELRQTCTALATGIVDFSVNCPPGQEPLFSRPPLMVRLAVDGQQMWVLVNHFKSKRGGEKETAARRLAQAEHVRQLVAEINAGSPEAWVVVVGDFNDYDAAPPLSLLKNVLIDLLAEIPAANRYSYIFSGRSQLIDGVLATPGLADAVSIVQIQHVNADFPAGWGTAVDMERLPYRATDHDLPLVIFTLPQQDGRLPHPGQEFRLTEGGFEANTVEAPEENANNLWLRLTLFITSLGGFCMLLIWLRRRREGVESEH